METDIANGQLCGHGPGTLREDGNTDRDNGNNRCRCGAVSRSKSGDSPSVDPASASKPAADLGISWLCSSCQWYMHTARSGRLSLNGRKANSGLPTVVDEGTMTGYGSCDSTNICAREAALALLYTVVNEGDWICTVETNVHEPPVPATAAAAAAAGTSTGAAVGTTTGCTTAALLTLLQPEPQHLNAEASSPDAPLQDVPVSAQLFAVDKPCGVPVHPSGGYQRNSLVHILEVEHEEYEVRPLHRLDRMTSGVVRVGPPTSSPFIA